MNDYIETLRWLQRHHEYHHTGAEKIVPALRWAIAELEAKEPQPGALVREGLAAVVKAISDPPPGTVRARFAAAVDAEGNWEVAGSSDYMDGEPTMLDAATHRFERARLQMVEVDLLKPVVGTVKGRVVP